jgi:NDP-sugar pyrophosphorylase family protein
MIRQALILAGGRGSRLGPLTRALPKPMLQVAGRPFLEHLISNLRRFGITRIVLSVGYLHDAIESYFQDGRKLDVAIHYSRETTPLGTGGGLRYGSHMLDDPFFVFNGDTLFDFNYLDLAMMLSPGMSAALALRGVEDASCYGSVCMKGDRVSQFMEKGLSGPGCINAGVYVLTREALDHLPKGYSSIERDLFPLLAQRNALAAKSYSGFFIDIGLPETLELADCSIPDWQRKPCVFLDGEAVTDEKTDGANGLYPFGWAEDAVQAIKWCNDHGYLVMVFFSSSNAAGGTGKGIAFRNLVKWMQEDLRRHAAHFDAVYRCASHSAADGLKYPCPSNWGDGFVNMVRQARNDWNIDVSRSAFMGTKPSDLYSEKCLGISGYLYNGGSLLTFIQRLMRPVE